jgi:hypothetical protein
MNWVPSKRPDWLAHFNNESNTFAIRDSVPLRAEELINTATASLGLTDFGDDEWREAFQVLTKALDEEAELNFFGRLFIREEILQALKTRLQIEDTYKKHPEINDQQITAPLFITGLSRSGTSILFERLAADPQFKPLLSWEILMPCPPPEAATYHSDPRIDQVENFMTLYNRVAPEFKSMHEMGARIPNECSEAFLYSFHSENIPAKVHVPSYANWLQTHGNWQYMYAYHKKFLKLLQWKNPRQHWLLKAPPHLWHLKNLFAEFPDAKVLYTHRDPLRANASNISTIGTLQWMRSDRAFDASSYERLLSPEVMAYTLNAIIDEFESSSVPKEKVCHVLYQNLIDKPWESIAEIYKNTNIPLDDISKNSIKEFIASKPQGKFGKHKYQMSQGDEEIKIRQLFKRYQNYYNVPNE